MSHHADRLNVALAQRLRNGGSQSLLALAPLPNRTRLSTRAGFIVAFGCFFAAIGAARVDARHSLTLFIQFEKEQQDADLPLAQRWTSPAYWEEDPFRVSKAEEEALRSRKRFQLIELHNFQRNGSKVFDLAQGLVNAAGGPNDARTVGQMRKQAGQIESELGKMIQYLNGQESRKKGRKTTTLHVTLSEAVAALVRTLNAVRADLLKVGQRQDLILDLQTRKSVVQQLEVAEQLAGEMAGH